MDRENDDPFHMVQPFPFGAPAPSTPALRMWAVVTTVGRSKGRTGGRGRYSNVDRAGVATTDRVRGWKIDCRRASWTGICLLYTSDAADE